MQTRTTTWLIEGLRDPANAEAWTGFDARYRPVLIAFARRLGFSPDDSIEVAQRALVEFAAAYREDRYRREQGRLSSWLIGIARHVASEMRRGRGARRVGGDTMLGELPDHSALTRIWAEERERAIFVESLEVLRAESRASAATMRAFELFALRGVPAERVAAECGITVDAVYVAKSRLTKRLREIVRAMDESYDDADQ